MVSEMHICSFFDLHHLGISVVPCAEVTLRRMPCRCSAGADGLSLSGLLVVLSAVPSDIGRFWMDELSKCDNPVHRGLITRARMRAGPEERLESGRARHCHLGLRTVGPTSSVYFLFWQSVMSCQWSGNDSDHFGDHRRSLRRGGRSACGAQSPGMGWPGRSVFCSFFGARRSGTTAS